MNLNLDPGTSNRRYLWGIFGAALFLVGLCGCDTAVQTALLTGFQDLASALVDALFAAIKAQLTEDNTTTTVSWLMQMQTGIC